MRLPIKDKKVSKFKFARHLVILQHQHHHHHHPNHWSAEGSSSLADHHQHHFLSPVVVQVSANLRAQVGTSVCVCVLLLSPGIDYANSALSAEVLLTTREQNSKLCNLQQKSSPKIVHCLVCPTSSVFSERATERV